MVAQQAAKKGPKSVETVYQKKTQLEHILLRPDTYIGKLFRVLSVSSKWVVPNLFTTTPPVGLCPSFHAPVASMNKIPSQILKEIISVFLVFLLSMVSHIIIKILIIWPCSC